ncbi:MAG: radical SAM protein [Proteobacteria bacterium]|nr:radical SAM protein [Pseudomonadota bacterium]
MTIDAIILQLPSPPRRNVFREWSGGMGTSLPSERAVYGHDQKYYDIPFSSFLYIARRLEQRGLRYEYADFQSKEIFDAAEFAGLLQRTAPKVLVTVVNILSFADDLSLLRDARKILPDLQIILIGPTAKWFKERILRDGDADIVMEESEELLVAENVKVLSEGGAREPLQGCSIYADGKVVTLPAREAMKDLSFVDFPAYELLDFSRYVSDYYTSERVPYAPVFTTKGCPYKCAYCPYPFGFGRRVLYRAPRLVGDDIERLNREFGVRQILFRDQVFTLNPIHARAVCDELIRRDLDITWVCETRYDVIDADMLDIMYRAGCREIHFGLESADPEMFANVSKPDGKGTLELFEQVIAMTKKRGITAHVHLIVGMPDESRSSLRNTRDWLRKVRTDSVQMAYFMPYPGTPYYDQLKKDGSLGDIDAIDWEDYGAFDRPVLASYHMTVDEIRRGRQRLAVDWQHTLKDRIVMFAKKAITRVIRPAA